MLKIRKPDVPVTTQGRINRLEAELAQATGSAGALPWVAERPYQAGEIVAKAGRYYKADVTISTGETVTPGENVTEIGMAEILNALSEEGE